MNQKAVGIKNEVQKIPNFMQAIVVFFFKLKKEKLREIKLFFFGRNSETTGGGRGGAVLKAKAYKSKGDSVLKL